MNDLTLLSIEDLDKIVHERTKEAIVEALNLKNSTQEKNPIMTRSEVAKHFQITLVTLHNWIKQGKLPTPTKIGNRTYFRSQDILEITAK